MISYIRGALEIKGDNYIVIECGGIGYQLMVSGKFMEKLPPVHSEIKVSTYMYIREDEISLFGFENADELNVFKILLGVSGVGPKVAMSLLSTLTVNELRLAVISEDVKAISKANGIGAKGASRIILELKDKPEQGGDARCSIQCRCCADRCRRCETMSYRHSQHLGIQVLSGTCVRM